PLRLAFLYLWVQVHPASVSSTVDHICSRGRPTQQHFCPQPVSQSKNTDYRGTLAHLHHFGNHESCLSCRVRECIDTQDSYHIVYSENPAVYNCGDSLLPNLVGIILWWCVTIRVLLLEVLVRPVTLHVGIVDDIR